MQERSANKSLPVLGVIQMIREAGRRLIGCRTMGGRHAATFDAPFGSLRHSVDTGRSWLQRRNEFLSEVGNLPRVTEQNPPIVVSDSVYRSRRALVDIFDNPHVLGVTELGVQ